MASARLSDDHALILAFAPAGFLALLLGVFGAIPAAAAGGMVALLVAGAVWFRNRPEPPAVDAAPRLAPPSDDIPLALLDRLPDPVIILDARRVVVAANRGARDLFGNGSVGRDLALSLRHPAVLAAADAIGAGVNTVLEEITLPAPVPRTFTLFAEAMPRSDAPGRPAVILVFHDETRAKRAEQSRADFVANASHELRSPLSALIGFIETLRGPARSDPEAWDRFLQIMRTEALRMARLIDDLLSLSRVEINEHVPPRASIDLAPLIAETARALHMRAESKDMTISVDCPPALPSVMGDKDQLIQVIHNLLDNAVKYGRAGTEIRVRAWGHALMPRTNLPSIAIAVTDQGEGIPAVHIPRITERFYRIDEGRSRKMGGTGLGLAIVKHIVNRHRGHLQIESTEGVGSTFTLFLPMQEERQSSASRDSGGERSGIVINL